MASPRGLFATSLWLTLAAQRLGPARGRPDLLPANPVEPKGSNAWEFTIK